MLSETQSVFIVAQPPLPGEHFRGDAVSEPTKKLSSDGSKDPPQNNLGTCTDTTGVIKFSRAVRVGLMATQTFI